ncbi:TPA: hypothetical protein ACPVZK_003489 [Vibrio parahaemolyticus]|uniref:hypothetical protein n=1 Tax=Vibrio parahaemolyticus TaxID=670 RepID=UPI000813386C|nr:hypothetical protein [Vibrio parahaemolyticus]EJG1730569.1 hypothetical protein [Vibrio parahaemolyticus]OCP40354.1 hypothetical protein AKH02_20475 [Vibrio parahaemolyticus]OCP41048.1 hypothetical protein AKH06_19745 [Vibrio parahaemolyticus]HCH2963644.1 hypothetical protein [Vibrio parahaemolyticus]HCM0856110.1 hypothetical protein [Vibrio parahaemolyticus]
MTDVNKALEHIENLLSELANTVVNALSNAGAGRVVDKELCEQAQYDIGAAMHEAKQLFQGNKNKFGKWRDENIIGNGKRTVDKRTLTRWTNLCEFGTLDECRKVGFTKVYKLSSKRYAPLREQIKQHLEQHPDVESDTINEMFNDFTTQLKTEKKQDTPVVNDDLVDKVSELESRLKELEHENANLRQQLEGQPTLEAA